MSTLEYSHTLQFLPISILNSDVAEACNSDLVFSPKIKSRDGTVAVKSSNGSVFNQHTIPGRRLWDRDVSTPEWGLIPLRVNV